MKENTWFNFHYLISYSSTNNLKALRRTKLYFLSCLEQVCLSVWRFERYFSHHLRRVEFIQSYKLDKLLNEYFATGVNLDKAFFNYSDYTLEERERERKVLSRGLRISIWPRLLYGGYGFLLIAVASFVGHGWHSKLCEILQRGSSAWQYTRWGYCLYRNQSFLFRSARNCPQVFQVIYIVLIQCFF